MGIRSFTPVIVCTLACALVGPCLVGVTDANAGPHRLLPPKGVCKDPSIERPLAEHRSAMRCLVREVRRRARRAPMRLNPQLDRSASHKSADLVRCGISHEACGHDFLYWMRQVGWGGVGTRWAAGENLAVGTGAYGSPYAIMNSWLSSPGHYRNLVRREWTHTGLGVRRGAYAGQPGLYWTEHFVDR